MTFTPTEEQWKRIDRAETVLRRYKVHLRKIALTPGVKSPNMDGMPKSPSFGNHVEDEIIEHVIDPNEKYCKYCKDILKAMKAESYEYSEALKMFYLGWNTQNDIKERFKLSPNPYYDTMKRAKLMFDDYCDINEIRKYEQDSKRIND